LKDVGAIHELPFHEMPQRYEILALQLKHFDKMPYNPDIHKRRSIRLKGYDYSSEGAYFITLCTHHRECLFGEIKDGKMMLNEYGKMVEQIWLKIPERYNDIILDEFVIMPNHFHGIIIINNNNDFVGAIHELPLRDKLPVQNEMPQRESNELPLQQNNDDMIHRRKMLLPKIIGYFKMNSAKQINQLRGTPGFPVWQRNYYERIVRDYKELCAIRQYIFDNPMNWENDENYIM